MSNRDKTKSKEIYIFNLIVAFRGLEPVLSFTSDYLLLYFDDIWSKKNDVETTLLHLSLFSSSFEPVHLIIVLSSKLLVSYPEGPSLKSVMIFPCAHFPNRCFTIWFLVHHFLICKMHCVERVFLSTKISSLCSLPCIKFLSAVNL